MITQAGAQTCPATACSNGLAAEFGVTGEPGETVTITADANFLLTGPGADMTVTVDAPATMDIDNATFNVGGTMAMNNNQLAGVYTGTYAISVAYQ